jgi:Fe/S biogenesis protein NfuA
MDDAAPTPPTDLAESAADAPSEPTGETAPKPVPLKVTDDAHSQVMSILETEDDPESLGLRIEVTGVQGVEYSYSLSFDEKAAAADDDLIYDQNGLTVMVPAASVDPLWGSTLDLPSTAGQGGLVIRNPNRPDPLAGLNVELEGTVEERIVQLLDQQINPGLASHGGYANLVKVIDDTKAVVTMGGGCQGCAVSAVTLREGIQKAIVTYVPEITEVVDVTDHDAGENPYYTDA